MKTVSQAEQALVELAEQFTHWRQSRASHERIPAPLWDQAVALSQVLPNGQVAKALRLSATDLKSRRLAQQASMPTPAPETDVPFIEVTPTAAGWSTGANPTQVEVQRPDGLRLRIGGVGSGELSELVRVFVEGGRCCS